MRENQPSVGKLHIFLLISLFGVLVWSAIKPHDYFTWLLEVLPALLAVAIFAFFYNRFRFTNLVYVVVWFHCIVLIVGGKYTYAEMPLFDYFKEVFGWSRNNYDKVGHFMQGFSPALIVREVFVRKRIVNGNGWTYFLAVCVPLAFSAFYEFVEWWVAVATGDSAEAFLGTQGYQWDTQTDMFMCMTGAILALAFLSRWQDRQMSEPEEK
jgi:putative membrane protein